MSKKEDKVFKSAKCMMKHCHATILPGERKLVANSMSNDSKWMRKSVQEMWREKLKEETEYENISNPVVCYHCYNNFFPGQERNVKNVVSST